MRKLAALMGALIIAFAVVADALAEDDAATPPPGGWPSVDPEIGELVHWLDDSDAPIASVIVDEVMRDNEEEYIDLEEPATEVEYVVFTVTVENLNARGTVDVIDLDFSLQDQDGYLWGASVTPIQESSEVAPLPDEGATLDNGESVTFLLVYEVDAGQELAHLFWQPDSGRLITLASLEGQ